MSQNNYSIMIIEALLRGENHVRGLAKLIGTNQTTTARKLNMLYEDSVVDYKRQGKNKVFFLKKTLEARQAVYAAESEKLLKLLRKYPHLRRIIELIKSNQSVKMAVLFGSYAKESAKKTSDIDIYIDTEDKSIKEYVEQIDSKISAKIGKYNKNSLLIKEMDKDHIIIKGIEEYYEKNKIFD